MTMSGFDIIEETKSEHTVPPKFTHTTHQELRIGNKAKRKALRRERWVAEFHATHRNSDWREDTLRTAALLTLSAWRGEGRSGFPPIPDEIGLNTLMSVVRGLGGGETKPETEDLISETQNPLPDLLSESDTDESDSDDENEEKNHLSSMMRRRQA